MLAEAGLTSSMADQAHARPEDRRRPAPRWCIRDRYAAGRAEAENRHRRCGPRVAALASRGHVISVRSCANAALRRRRATALYLAGNRLAQLALRREAELRQAAGLAAQFARPCRAARCFGIRPRRRPARIDNLTINPREIAARLLIRAAEAGGRLFAPVDIVDIRRTRPSVVATTRDGKKVRCRHLVLASGYEFPNRADEGPPITTTWAFATAPQRRRLWPEECLIWEASTPYLYARTTPDGRVLCGGEDGSGSVADHGEAQLARKIARLQRKLGKLFPVSTPMRHSAGRPRSAKPPPDFPRSARCRVRGITGSRSAMAATASPIQPDRRGSDPRRADRRPDADADLYAFKT